MNGNLMIIMQALAVLGLILKHIVSVVYTHFSDKRKRKKKQRAEETALRDMHARGSNYDRNSYPPQPWDYTAEHHGHKYYNPYNQSYYPPPARPPQRPPSKREEPRFWELEDYFILRALHVLKPIVRELVTAYVTLLVLNQSGYFHVSPEDWVLQFVFYAIRPRPAPFFGAMGFFKHSSQEGLAELAFDMFLSLLGGGYITTQYWRLYNNPVDPVAPRDTLKFLSVGSAMSVVPTYAFLTVCLFGFGIAICLFCTGSRQNKQVLGYLFWMFMIMSINLLMIFLVVVALIEALAATVFKIRYRKDDDRAKTEFDQFMDDRVLRRGWGSFLSSSKPSFRFTYGGMLACSIVANVGNWIFFVTYLKEAGDLYCPTRKSQILAMLILLSLGIEVVFGAFMYWTKALWKR